MYSLQVYGNIDPFQDFNSEIFFEKWALMEVSDFDNIPKGMEALVLAGGLYAVFDHQWYSTEIFQDIFQTWVPNSNFKFRLQTTF